MARIVKIAKKGISYLELLLNENLCSGTVKIETSLVAQVGGINQFLKAKKKYELLIRVAKEIPVEIVDIVEAIEDKQYITLSDEASGTKEYGWQTDCYITARYSLELQQNNLFDSVISAILEEAKEEERELETLRFLEQMLQRKKEYWRIAEGSQPILIYKGDSICHNVLNVFAEQFGQALSSLGKQIIYFDCEKEPINLLTRYMYQHFQAIIGVQSYLFSVKMQDEVHYLHEYIYGPKFNFIFDHPIWMKQHLMHHYSDYYVLTHDNNYVTFLKRYYGKDAILFPPAGIISCSEKKTDRIYDLTFVGTYGNYWNEVLLIHQMDCKKRFLANRFLLKMRKNPDMTAEQALNSVLKERGEVLSDDDFLDLLYDLRRVIYCIMHYYRDRVLRCILESGIQIDVFGDSWEQCPLTSYSNLVCHPNVTVEESLVIWQSSKLSLNIMSWHKGGFTERMANIMLAGAVLVTDDTTYLSGQYGAHDLLSFRLEERSELPEKIKRLLCDEDMRKEMAENGKQKTLQNHTWEKRAEQFLKLLEER